MPEIRVTASCHPTEDVTKIVHAIKGIFPDAEFDGENPVVAKSSSLDSFAELLKKQRIRDAARQVMRKNRHGQVTSFRLNKQVAAIGKLSFSEEEHPLGDIEVVIHADDIESLVDQIAPSTRLEVSR